MKYRLLFLVYCLLAVFAVSGFGTFAQGALTYTQLRQNPEETMSKYEDVWSKREIVEKPAVKRTYESGELVGTITIPKMGYYEMPIYYGSNLINNNWQITTPGYLGNWDMFGEDRCAAVGAHNYQLFSNLPLMEDGDLFIIETEDDLFIYEVIGRAIYDHTKDDWSQVSYQDSLPYSVSLMTCYPIEQGAEATEDTYIVYSQMVSGTKYISNTSLEKE